MSFIAAITLTSVISCQLIEGNVDSVLFEDFIYETLNHVRSNQDMKDKDVVLFMDNAVIHRHSAVLETVRKFKVITLFNAEYSP